MQIEHKLVTACEKLASCPFKKQGQRELGTSVKKFQPVPTGWFQPLQGGLIITPPSLYISDRNFTCVCSSSNCKLFLILAFVMLVWILFWIWWHIKEISLQILFTCVLNTELALCGEIWHWSWFRLKACSKNCSNCAWLELTWITGHCKVRSWATAIW